MISEDEESDESDEESEGTSKTQKRAGVRAFLSGLVNGCSAPVIKPCASDFDGDIEPDIIDIKDKIESALSLHNRSPKGVADIDEQHSSRRRKSLDSTESEEDLASKKSNLVDQKSSGNK
eukprot:8271425-Ditylum_brightwellii.AAC.1